MRWRSFIWVALAVDLAASPPARALPDLVPEAYAVRIETDQSVGSGDVAEGCAAATTGRTLLRFGLRMHNDGDQPEVIGDPGCPDCRLFPGAPCANPNYQCSPADGHMHPHFAGFARYELLDWSGNVVALGAKRGFCIRDDGPDTNPACSTFTCSNQGLTPGCFDDYAPTLGCQYIDVTDVPGITDRAFRLRVTADPLQLLVDGDRTNNVIETMLPGCGDGVLQDGEACDPALPVAGQCCDADCQIQTSCGGDCILQPAGTVCRLSTGPCDVAEVCDGVSPTCPPDRVLDDGASCGDGMPPCIAMACAGGACAADRELGGCLVGGACFPAGATDPDDACLHCDPSRSVDVWSPNRDPDPAGIACQLTRVTMATVNISCPPGITRTLERRLARAGALAGRLASAGPGTRRRVESRLLRIARRLGQVLERGRRHGCHDTAASEELGALEQQLRAMAASEAPHRSR